MSRSQSVSCDGDSDLRYAGYMRLSLIFLLAALCGIAHPRALLGASSESRPIVTQTASSNGQPSSATQGETPQPARVDIDRDAKIIVTNADDSLAHWNACVEPSCNPGGKGIAVSTRQSIGNTDPSIDGAAMLLSQTADSKHFFTDVLWSYKSRACEAPVPNGRATVSEYIDLADMWAK